MSGGRILFGDSGVKSLKSRESHQSRFAEGAAVYGDGNSDKSALGDVFRSSGVIWNILWQLQSIGVAIAFAAGAAYWLGMGQHVAVDRLLVGSDYFGQGLALLPLLLVLMVSLIPVIFLYSYFLPLILHILISIIFFLFSPIAPSGVSRANLRPASQFLKILGLIILAVFSLLLMLSSPQAEYYVFFATVTSITAVLMAIAVSFAMVRGATLSDEIRIYVVPAFIFGLAISTPIASFVSGETIARSAEEVGAGGNYSCPNGGISCRVIIKIVEKGAFVKANGEEKPAGCESGVLFLVSESDVEVCATGAGLVSSKENKNAPDVTKTSGAIAQRHFSVVNSQGCLAFQPEALSGVMVWFVDAMKLRDECGWRMVAKAARDRKRAVHLGDQ